MVKQRKEKRKKGACSDSYMEEKIRYIQHQRDRQKIKNKKYATSSTIDYFAIVATRQKMPCGLKPTDSPPATPVTCDHMTQIIKCHVTALTTKQYEYIHGLQKDGDTKRRGYIQQIV